MPGGLTLFLNCQIKNKTDRFHNISYPITGCTAIPIGLSQYLALLKGDVHIKPNNNSVVFAQCSPFTISPNLPIV